ncbi:phage integrase [Escherichia coli]|nr:phage integrase [Escherichia coli]
MSRAQSVVGVIKGTKTKAGTRKVELTEEAMLALIKSEAIYIHEGCYCL